MKTILISLLFVFGGYFSWGQKSPEKEIVRIVKYSGYGDSIASYWVKVAKFETGYFTSKRFVQHNNPWGMRYAYKRNKTCMGKTPKGFAHYCTKNDGYWDIILYMRAREFPKEFSSLEEFTRFLKSKYYFEESYNYYYGGLKSIK